MPIFSHKKSQNAAGLISLIKKQQMLDLGNTVAYKVKFSCPSLMHGQTLTVNHSGGKKWNTGKKKQLLEAGKRTTAISSGHERFEESSKQKLYICCGSS